jgi:hypothetical protein
MKTLTTPINMGQMDTLGPSNLTVTFGFDVDAGDWKIKKIMVGIEEGEIRNGEFVRYAGGQVTKLGKLLPPGVIADLDKIVNAALDLYAVEKDYA